MEAEPESGKIGPENRGDKTRDAEGQGLSADARGKDHAPHEERQCTECGQPP
jgi:hypothetical protein